MEPVPFVTVSSNYLHNYKHKAILAVCVLIPCAVVGTCHYEGLMYSHAYGLSTVDSGGRIVGMIGLNRLQHLLLALTGLCFNTVEA